MMAAYALASLILDMKYHVAFRDEATCLVSTSSGHNEVVACYTLREAERLAFGGVVTQINGWSM